MRLTRWFVVAALCALASGCGGGGGGSNVGGGAGGSSAQYSVSVSPAKVQFSTIVGPTAAMTQQVTATFVGDGLVVGYPPGVATPTWLSVNVVGTPHSSPVQVQFVVAAATFTFAQTFTTTVRFVSGKADGSQVVTQDVPVTLTVRDPFRLDTSKVELDATQGTPANTRQVTVQGLGINWTATPDQAWVRVSPASSSSTAIVTVGADTTGLAVGTYTANVHFADAASGTAVDLPVSLYISANRWNVSRNGVMLLEFSDLAAPVRSVTVTNDASVAASWTASADVPWLDVTSGGTNGNSLSVQPNAATAGLTVDSLYIGTVTVTGAGLQSDKLRVGYYRSSHPTPSSYEVSLRDGTGESLAVDPIRPYVYVALLNGSEHLMRVNIATQAVDTILSTPGTKLRYPVVSGDGHYLYAVNGQTPGGYEVYDLDAGQASATWPRTTLCCGGQAAWVRTRGVPALINANLEVVNAETGVYSPPAIPTADFASAAFATASGNGKAFYTFGFDTTNCEPAQRYEITSRPAAGQVFIGNQTTIQATPPRYGGCVSVDALVPTYDDSARYFVGVAASTYQGLIRLSAAGLTEVSVGNYGRNLAMTDSGLKLIPTYNANNYMVLREFGANDQVVGTDFGNYLPVDEPAFAFSNDERFALIVNSSSFDLYRLP